MLKICDIIVRGMVLLFYAGLLALWASERREVRLRKKVDKIQRKRYTETNKM